MILFYIRHGDPIYDPDSLTPLGHRQAEAVAKRLARYGVDEVYSSSSTRAVLTSKPTCEMLKKEPVLLDWCHEHLAWQELVHDGEDGRRDWLFAWPHIASRFVSREFAALGENWADHHRWQPPDCRAVDDKYRHGRYRGESGAG